ncbi:unnamed protein product [Rhizophagus irregularis]|uniref:Uncharacterized protein n=1 Tax=Rhizophagus irregularis TaxID=588596 RepID=A0A916E9R9_9GLOM|nr:unnamed protein product [Rhizophagus irregularis]
MRPGINTQTTTQPSPRISIMNGAQEYFYSICCLSRKQVRVGTKIWRFFGIFFRFGGFLLIDWYSETIFNCIESNTFNSEEPTALPYLSPLPSV